MGKILFVSHTANFAKFNKPYMKWFSDMGWEVHYASREEEPAPLCDKHFMIPFERSPIKVSNLKALFQLKKLIDTEKYDIIHCHTPVGGAITRIAAISARKHGTAVIYTAHGFHFCKGSPKKNWLMFYPVEKVLAKFTDCLITINNEDYNLAVNNHFKAGVIEKINGVGVDISLFKPADEQRKKSSRLAFNIPEDAFAMMYVAEFTERKNQRFLIENMQDILKKIPQAQLLLAGVGDEFEHCKALAKQLGIDDRVHFLGYCKNVPSLCELADVVVCSSRREGLPINVVEGMASGLPVVCTAIRGQTELIEDGVNGYLFTPGNSEAYKKAVLQIYNDPETVARFSRNTVEKVKTYSLDSAINVMAEIYKRYM